jgi:hypothetical protein
VCCNVFIYSEGEGLSEKYIILLAPTGDKPMGHDDYSFKLDISSTFQLRQENRLRLRNRLLNKQELTSSRLICIFGMQVSLFLSIVSPVAHPHDPQLPFNKRFSAFLIFVLFRS